MWSTVRLDGKSSGKLSKTAVLKHSPNYRPWISKRPTSSKLLPRFLIIFDWHGRKSIQLAHQILDSVPLLVFIPNFVDNTPLCSRFPKKKAASSSFRMGKLCMRKLLFSVLLTNGSWLREAFSRSSGAYSPRNFQRVISMVLRWRATFTINIDFDSVPQLFGHSTQLILLRKIHPICCMVGWQKMVYL